LVSYGFNNIYVFPFVFRIEEHDSRQNDQEKEA
jgi:hypothetical protein